MDNETQFGWQRKQVYYWDDNKLERPQIGNNLIQIWTEKNF